MQILLVNRAELVQYSPFFKFKYGVCDVEVESYVQIKKRFISYNAVDRNNKIVSNKTMKLAYSELQSVSKIR